jgi:hypothetical protein
MKTLYIQHRRQMFNIISMNSLKIPQGYSETVNRRQTDNTMAKRKRTNDNHRNLKGSNSCLTSGTDRATLATKK